ncbi:hypothetical protein H1Z61_05910 [Bacillus aquiflavi]|uniref:Uncharacterized protein n=1 Tax=Bacillus aquiflavi TaxID=2672567 RepID=A0A6B3VUX1_9BACI|nr:hypothetical protein [Bacillus aquiflavi]MBA4536690.1 hypothetical protein [Bacillus aquiflavi]NEY81058.1 hypothetical protein [Bacillus aquiflavi]
MNIEFLEVKAFFFGTEEQKRKTYFSFILPFFKEIDGEFSAERDWNGGPHYRIILPKHHDQLLVHFEKDFKAYVKREFGDLSKVELEENIEQYVKHHETIAGMESRSKEEINAGRHLTVAIHSYDEAYLRQTFNSYQHFVVHTQSLFFMQKFISSFGERFFNLPKEKKYLYFTKMLYEVLTFSSFHPKFAVLVYVSNIEGVFAIAEQYGKRAAFEKAYQTLYKSLPFETLANDPEFNELGATWKDTIGNIYSLIKENVKNLFTDEEGFYSKELQKEELVQNIQGISSEFHDLLLKQDVEEWTNHEEHVIYRVLINIVYKSAHMLQFTFTEKNFACYAVCEYVMDKYHTTWREIMAQRGINA